MLVAPAMQSSEEHLTVKQLANEWRLSSDAVRRLFIDEPGVIVISKSKPGKRPRRTLRIPRSVADRFKKK
jgi:hypothetical protein